MIWLGIWLIVGAMVPSLLITWAGAHAVRRWGPRWGLVDHPGHRKVHSAPMPTSGGLAIWLGVRFIPRLAAVINRLPISQGVMALVIVVTLLYAWAAEALGGVAAITGAFL